MHNINNTNNAQFDDKNPPASPKVFAFGFFAENRYICTVMHGDTAAMRGQKLKNRLNSLIYIGLTFVRKHLYPHF